MRDGRGLSLELVPVGADLAGDPEGREGRFLDFWIAGGSLAEWVAFLEGFSGSWGGWDERGKLAIRTLGIMVGGDVITVCVPWSPLFQRKCLIIFAFS